MKRRLAIIAAILAALTLAACGPSYGDANKAAAEFCKGHGGVDEIEYYSESWPTENSFDVYCRDGSEIE